MSINLKEVIDEQGRKHSWLADKVGISHSAMSRLVQGRKYPTREVGDRIAAVLGVSVERLWPDIVLVSGRMVEGGVVCSCGEVMPQPSKSGKCGFCEAEDSG